MDGRPHRGSWPGGTLAGEPLIDTAARVALAGMDPMRYLETADLEVATVMVAIVKRADELRDRIADDDATRTANAVARMLRGK